MGSIVKAGVMVPVMLLLACANEVQSDEPVPVSAKVTQTNAPAMQNNGAQQLQQGYKPMLVGQAQITPEQQRGTAMAKGEAMFTGVLTTRPDAKGLSVTLTITNPRSVGVAIQYRSGMTADLWLVDPNGTRLWAWSSEMMFTQALRDVVIAANKSFSVKFLVPAKALAKAPSGSVLVAKYAGRLQDSSMQAMADVQLPLLR